MEQTKYDVFISYSRKDTAIANHICKALDKQGISYFIDRQGIGGGQEFPEILAEAIVGCRIMLYLASKNSYKSKYISKEITFAFNEKPDGSILPYIVDGSLLPPTQRFIFSSVNIRTQEDHPIDTVLMRDLCKLLGCEYREETREQDDEEGKPKAEEAKKIDHESVAPSTPSKRKRLLLWSQKRKKWLAAFFLTIASITGLSVYSYLYRYRIVEKLGEREGMVLVKNAMGYYGFASMTGKEVIPCQWDSAISFSGGLAAVRNDKGNWGYIDKMGKVVSSCQWKDAKGFSEGLAVVMDDNGEWVKIDKTGKIVEEVK